MLKPEKSLSLFPSFLFGTSAILFKRAPLQLASLQLWLFMNCCTVHWRCCHYLLLALCFPAKFFSAFSWQIISFFLGKRIASVNCSAMEANHFFSFWIVCSWCLTDLFCRGSLSSKLISARFELTSVKCLVLFLFWLDLAKYLPDFFSDRDYGFVPSACYSYAVCCLFLVWYAFLFQRESTWFWAPVICWFLTKSTDYMYLKPACYGKKLVL